MFSDRRHIAVALAGAGAFLNLYAPQAILPLLAAEFAASTAEISFIMTASTLAMALTAPFTGAIADVLGRKHVIIAAMLALVIPTLMIAFSPSLEAMVFWRFVQGLLLPPIFAVTVAYIGGEWPAAEATGVTGIYTAAAGLSGFLGRLMTGLLAEPAGWRIAFIAYAVLTAAFAIGVILLLPRERKFVRAANLRSSFRQMLGNLRNPQLVATYAVGFGVLFNFIAIFTFVNFLLAAPPFNLSPAALGAIFVVYLAGTITTPWTGRLVAYFGRRRFVIGAITAWGCGIALTLAPSLAVIIVGLAIAAACGFFVQASSQSFVAISAKRGISSAIGLYVTAFYIGGSVGGFLPGLAFEHGGWPSTVALVAAMLAIMALIVRVSWAK
ncbi:MAG: MFS transporter [Rhizobiales bacterium]|nr:MFS transporter [Hyphomicrobiales bacterium]